MASTSSLFVWYLRVTFLDLWVSVRCALATTLPPSPGVMGDSDLNENLLIVMIVTT